MCVGRETAKEFDAEIEIIHECFTERGDSILSVLASCMQVKLQNK